MISFFFRIFLFLVLLSLCPSGSRAESPYRGMIHRNSPKEFLELFSKEKISETRDLCMDTIPKSKSDSLTSKNITKEAVEDSDFEIKKPAHKFVFINDPKKSAAFNKADGKFHSRKAWLYSLVVPGLGQYYNHSYIKIPILYGLFVSAVLYINFNNTLYQEALTAYKTRLINNNALVTPIQYGSNYIAQVSTLNTVYVQYYRKNLDLGVIAAVGVWALGAIDAFVVSELKGFDVSNDLSLRIRPALLQNPIITQPSLNGYIPGIKLTFNFR